MSVFSKLTMAAQDCIMDMSWTKIFWTGNIAIVIPSLAMVLAQHTITDKTKRESSVGESASSLKFWQFRKRIHYYYLFGLLFSGWLGWNAFWTYVSGDTFNERLEDLCNWAYSPKQVTVDAASSLLTTEAFMIHLLHRLYVSTRVSIFSRREALNLVDIGLSFSFYGAAALSIYAESPDFGLIQDLSSAKFDWIEWHHIAGVALFIAASIPHYQAHKKLSQLRINKSGHIVSTGYKIPRGGLFDYVSCPHYLSEALIYTSMGLMLGMRSKTWWLLTGYVCSNQIYQAYSTHMWYKNKFQDYPKDRKMLIPFVL